MTVIPTERKVAEIREFAGKLLRTSKVTARRLACFLGKVLATLLACEQGNLHYRAFARDEIFNLKAHKGSYDANLTLTDTATEELHWWVENI